MLVYMMSMGSFPKHLKLSVWLAGGAARKGQAALVGQGRGRALSSRTLGPHALVVGQRLPSYRLPPHSPAPTPRLHVVVRRIQEGQLPGVMRAPLREPGCWEDPHFLGWGHRRPA